MFMIIIEIDSVLQLFVAQVLFLQILTPYFDFIIKIWRIVEVKRQSILLIEGLTFRCFGNTSDISGRCSKSIEYTGDLCFFSESVLAFSTSVYVSQMIWKDYSNYDLG